MKIAISQPTYLPWQGYFALIDYVDEFIFLENIQFNKRSWQQRNKIINNGKEIFLTIPVKSKGKYHQNIIDVELDNFDKFKQKQILSIKNSYSKCRYFEQYFGGLEKILNKNHTKLAELNKELILQICKNLDIKTNISNDSNFKLSSKKSDYLKDICLIKNCSNYISTLGAKNYFGDIKYIPNTKIKIDYFDFRDEEYFQKSEKFISRLSIIDLVFNLGPDALKYLRKNFYICQ
ncbi:WbqC family protein [Candidatus Pelagibacter sp. HIMB1495]|uniref:WbqC family protein n=1 Tax=unclassified Candidatus Pelagibacter TaxID=2647897 RepID=UPI003F868EA5